MSASSNQPATVSALTGGLSMTTSAMPSPSMVCEMPKEVPNSDLMDRQLSTANSGRSAEAVTSPPLVSEHGGPAPNSLCDERGRLHRLPVDRQGPDRRGVRSGSSHLDLDWDNPAKRHFVKRLATSRRHAVRQAWNRAVGSIDRVGFDRGAHGRRSSRHGRVVRRRGPGARLRRASRAGDRGTKGIGRSIAARFAAAGATVVVCGRTEPDADRPAGSSPATCATPSTSTPWSTTSPSTRAASTRRQRGLADARPHRVAAIHRGDHPAEPPGADARGAGRQPRDAGRRTSGGSIVNIAQRQRHPAHAERRGVRRGEGRPAQPHADARGRVGAEGAGQRGDRRARAHRAGGPALRRRGRRRRASARPCRSGGWPSRSTWPTPACSSPRRSRRTSPAPTCSCTAAANVPPT